MASALSLDSRPTIRAITAATACVGMSALFSIAPAMATSPASQADLTNTRDFIESQLRAGAGADKPFVLPGASAGSEDVGLTLDYLLALDALGGDETLIDSGFDAITQEELLGNYLLAEDSSTGVFYADINRTAKLVYVASHVGYSSPAIEDLINQLLGSLDENGRAHDRASTGSLDTEVTNFGQSWVIIALEKLGRSELADDAAANLANQLCRDGGIPLYYKAEPDCMNVDPDTTAIAVQALSSAAGPEDTATTSAIDYLRKVQKPNGGFTTRSMGGSEFVNVNTTSLAAGAFVAVGDSQGFARAHTYLDSARFDENAADVVHGAFAQTPEDSGQQKLNDTIRRTSGQAALAFAGHNYIGSEPITDFAEPSEPVSQAGAEDTLPASEQDSSNETSTTINFGLIVAVIAIIAVGAGAVLIQFKREN